MLQRLPAAVRRLVLAAALGGLALGCTSSARQSSPATSPVSASTAPQLAEPYRLVATAIDGSAIALADYAATPVVLWFWAPT